MKLNLKNVEPNSYKNYILGNVAKVLSSCTMCLKEYNSNVLDWIKNKSLEIFVYLPPIVIEHFPSGCMLRNKEVKCAIMCVTLEWLLA